MTRHVVGLVEETKAKGELRSTIDAEVFATAFASFYYFALIGWVQEGVATPLPLFEVLMAQHIGGLTPGEAPTRARSRRGTR